MSRPLPGPAVARLRGLGSPDAEPAVSVAPHLTGAAAGRIVVPWCPACSRAHWYPVSRCPRCGGRWQWRDVGVDAELHSWTTVCRPLAPALREHVPHTVALAVPVEAPEIRLVATLVLTSDSAAPRIGQRLVARPGSELDGGRLLAFEPGEDRRS